MALDKKSEETWAKLYAMVATQEARVKANPIPHLNKMGREIVALRTAIEESLYILSGAADMCIAEDSFPEMEPDICNVSLERQHRIDGILGSALRSARMRK